jgi:hypothetical protein
MARENRYSPKPVPGPSFKELFHKIDPDSKLKSLAGNVGINPSDEEIVSNFNTSLVNRPMMLGNSTHLGIGSTQSGNIYYCVHVLGTDSKKVKLCPKFS